MVRQVLFLLDSPRLRTMFVPCAESLQACGVKTDIVSSLAAVPAELQQICDIVVAPGYVNLEAEYLSGWPRLRAVVSVFAGIEGFDLAGFSASNVLVANGAAEENSISTAEATILLMLAAWYDLDGTVRVAETGGFPPLPPRARMLMGRTVGVVGYGAIGRRVVERLEGWGVDVLVHSRTSVADLPAGAHWADLDTLLAACDIVCLCAALNPASRHLLDDRRLRLMKPDALLVNTARGGLVDENALVGLLGERPEMRAALDVFEIEPLPAESPLRKLPNVVLTPHSVSHTQESVTALPRLLLANVEAILDGRMPPSPCNAEISDRWRERWA